MAVFMSEGRRTSLRRMRVSTSMNWVGMSRRRRRGMYVTTPVRSNTLNTIPRVKVAAERAINEVIEELIPFGAR